MKTITVDENAHAILLWAKKACREKGFGSPNFSDAIRWMRERIAEAENEA